MVLLVVAAALGSSSDEGSDSHQIALRKGLQQSQQSPHEYKLGYGATRQKRNGEKEVLAGVSRRSALAMPSGGEGAQ